jgi:hypothetical protein
MRHIILGICLLVIMFYIVNVQSAAVRKRSLSNFQAKLQLRNILLDHLHDRRKASMLRRDESSMKWDLDAKESVCVWHCAAAPDDEFEDCYTECMA